MNNWQLFVQVVIEELEKIDEKHSCIMAAAIIIDALTYLKIDNAYPLTVKPRILNPQFVERLKNEAFPDTPEKLNQWKNDGCNIVLWLFTRHPFIKKTCRSM